MESCLRSVPKRFRNGEGLLQCPATAWDERMKDFHARRAAARGMGGPERLARRRAAGALNARERVARLLDPDSFLEIGTFNASDVPGMEAETPADSKVGGFGRIDGRPVVVCSNDFTVLAATSSRVASYKEAELKRVAARRGLPVVSRASAGGARMPHITGAAGAPPLAPPPPPGPPARPGAVR